MNVTDHPRLVVAIAVVFTSLSAIFVRLTSAPPLVIAAFRMLFSTVLLLPASIRNRAGEWSSITPKDIAVSVAGGVFLAVHFATWISSLSYTSVASATVLVNTQPVFLAVAAWIILRERLSVGEAAAIVGAIGGSAVLAGVGGSGSELTGDGLALTGAIAMAGYMIVGRFVRRRMGVLPYTVTVYGSAAVLLSITSVVAGHPLAGYPATDYLLFGAMAVFCTLLGHSLMNWALAYLDATFIGTAFLGEPVIASALAALLFAEYPTVATVVGGAIILVSLYAFTRFAAMRSRDRGAPDR